MTKEQALHAFFNKFGIAGYRSTSVPDDAVFDYLTYTCPVSSIMEDPVSITVHTYHRTESEAIPDKLAEDIRKRIGMGGVMLCCEGGAIWLKWGSPWCQSIFDDTDKTLKRRYINITAEFLTI